MDTIGIIGAGSFGTALGQVLQNNGNEVLFYVRTPRNLSNSTTSIEQLFTSCQLIVIVIPVENIPSLLTQIKKFVKPHHYLVHCIKGLITTAENEVLTVSKAIKKELRHDNVGCLSGPNLANEIKNSQLTSAVIASDSSDLAKLVKTAINNEKFIVYESADLLGVELCGVLKNIIALASGILHGLGEGDNAKSLLMTMGIKEMLKIAKILTPNVDEKTFYGVAGLGDLIATCCSLLSRNFTLGKRIAYGEKLRDIICEGAPEGVQTTSIIYDLTVRRNITLPITFAVYKILFTNENPEFLKKVLIENFNL